MRRSLIWFALALFWSLDSLLALRRHNRQQVLLTALFACCFLAIGIVFRVKERRRLRSGSK